MSDAVFGFLAQLPPISFLALVIFFPLAQSLYISFFDYSIVRGVFQFVGLDNYRAIWANPGFATVAMNTVYFTTCSIVGVMLVGLFVALVLNENFRGRGVARTLLLLPWALPGIVSGIMWKWIFSGSYGVLNYVLFSIGAIDNYISFLGDEFWAMPATIVAYVWKGFPWVALLIMAGLQSIPKDLYEQAAVDGASMWRRFSRVTLPLLRGVIVLTLIFETIWTLRAFDVIYALTQGGPFGSTTVLGWWIYERSFGALDFGMGAAISWILTAITVAVTILYYRLFYSAV